MVSKEMVSVAFAGIAGLLGLGSLVSIGMGHPTTAIPLAILAIGSEYASYLHSKLA